MAKKGGREKIRLNSTAGTGHFYTTDKNRRTTPGKMEMMKYHYQVLLQIKKTLRKNSIN